MAKLLEVQRYVTLSSIPGKIRIAKHEGREHVVVPVVALIEGVIHAVNSPKAELVRADIFSRNASSWNGRPVFAGHPVKNGTPVSGNDPEILETSAGKIFNSKSAKKRLCMEAWLDRERCKTGENAVLLARAETGKPIEVSVGALVTLEDLKGTWDDGRDYDGAWETIGPDHLAMLGEHQRGACSLEMGCGALRANAEGEIDFLTVYSPEEISQIELDKLEPTPRAACACGGHSTNNATGADKGEKNMERKDRHAALVANPHNPVKNLKTLEAMSDEDIKALEDAAVVNAKNAADLKAANEATTAAETARIAAETAKTAAEAAAVKAQADLKTAQEAPITEERLPADYKAIVISHRAAEAKEKDDLVTRLKGAQTVLTEEQLKAKTIEDLRTLAAIAKIDAPAADYSARGIAMPRVAAEADAATRYAPKDPWAKKTA